LSIISSYPLISVVIPTYNRVSLLQKAIASVIAQTYTNWELIVVDDGSTDNTAQLIKSLRDSRIHILELPHSGHIGNLFNAGVKAGTGEWIAFLASDDTWLPNKLELQLEVLNKSGSRWTYSNFELVNEAGETIAPKAGRYHPISGWIIKQLLTTEAAVTMCSVMLQRSLFEEVGGFSTDLRLLYRGDYELALRLALKAEVVALPDVLVRVLEHPARITNGLKDGHERTALAYEIFLEGKHAKDLKHLARRRRGYQIAEAASKNLCNGNYIVAGRQFAGSLAAGAGLRQWLSALYRGVKACIAGLTTITDSYKFHI
jgi:glycosyltransferase involved in cell wall biosynthesis